jgi:uncharacterized repeat protein (TIGR03803 family)
MQLSGTQKLSSILSVALALATIVFSLAVSARAQTETVLYEFTGHSDGSGPLAGLVSDSAGNLYGTAGGAVFELSPVAGGGWTHSTISTFTQGRLPESPLILDAAGNLYGTTSEGGTSGDCNDGEGCGIVYELSLIAGVWTETVLYNFTGGSDGGSPMGNLVFDSVGNLYGTANIGGNLSCSTSGMGCGVVFELSPASTGWTETVLHAFIDKKDGAYPVGGVTIDAAGNLYGTTSRGGNINVCPGQVSGCGMVFQLTPSSTGWTEHSLHTFGQNAGGYAPQAAVVLDAAGNLYGTTETGGGVFRLTPTTTGPWTFSLLETLQGRGGANPLTGVTIDASGNLYGTTNSGGDLASSVCNSNGCGVVFKLSPTSSGPWTETVMHSFTGGPDGRFPFRSGVILDGAGNLYGVTEEGGIHNDCSGIGCGVVYKVTP